MKCGVSITTFSLWMLLLSWASSVNAQSRVANPAERLFPVSGIGEQSKAIAYVGGTSLSDASLPGNLLDVIVDYDSVAPKVADSSSSSEDMSPNEATTDSAVVDVAPAINARDRQIQ